jgi:L-iditol 2-dehydrogenase
MKVIASDLLDARLKKAKAFGAHMVYRFDQLREGEGPREPIYFSSAEVPAKFHGSRGRSPSLSGSDAIQAAIVCAPSEAAVQQAINAVSGGGQVLLFAHTRRGDAAPIDLSKICVDEKDLIGSYSSDFSLQDEVARLVFSRRMDVRPLITHQFPLEEINQGIELAAHPTADSLKILIKPVSGP